MNKNFSDNTFPTWEEIGCLLRDTLGEPEKTLLVERIRRYEPEDDSGKGLKRWLENNNYDLQRAALWLSSVERRIQPKQRNSSRSLVRYAAAAVLLAAIITGIFLIKPGTPAWQQYYIHDPGFPVFMNTRQVHDEWMQEYREGNFQQALIKQAPLAQNAPHNDTLAYYRAVMLFELDSTEEAISQLASAAIDSSSGYYYSAQLLRGFCLWRLGKLHKAREAFRQVASSPEKMHAATAHSILSKELSAIPAPNP